jgi:phenylalanyl-tRNA synthetase beta chain
MKIAYKHLVRHIVSNPSIEEISNKFFQLGHEHEIENDIFDMELTPNRGDCLSVKGLLRELKLFYEVSSIDLEYEKEINPLSFNFKNNAENECPYISFLKIEIEEIPSSYNGSLDDYFVDLNVKKNNFFTDVSNYLSYETGQPTHCYDASKLGDKLSLNFIEDDCSFETLLDKTITLSDKNLVFQNSNNDTINLAGVVGGKSTACNKNTTSVIIECAYFSPEIIVGKTVKYGIKSDAAHKFERGADPVCHEKVLRRFVKIIEEHAIIKDVSLYKKNTNEFKNVSLPLDVEKVNSIIGINISNNFDDILFDLGFRIEKNSIIVPSHRSDIHSINDIAEEIARSIGYDNIPRNEVSLPVANSSINNLELSKQLKNFLISHGFHEVINNPFVGVKSNSCISVDNPLDSNRKFLRTSLKSSLVENLLYNERRQKDSIKFFEISNIYNNDKDKPAKKVIGIIASGRLDKNYRDFSKKIDKDYLPSVLLDFAPDKEFKSDNIARESLDTKLKTPISYVEFEIAELEDTNILNENKDDYSPKEFNEYVEISDFPISKRDLSFSISDPVEFKNLENFILSYENNLLKEVYVFDFYNNTKNNEIKIGFRFIFQSKEITITEQQVNEVVDDIINHALLTKSVHIPGLLNK